MCTPDVSVGEATTGGALAVDGRAGGPRHAEPSSMDCPPAHLVAVYAQEAQVVIVQVASAGNGQ